MLKRVATCVVAFLLIALAPAQAAETRASENGAILPFPPVPTASVAGRLQECQACPARRTGPFAGGRAQHPDRLARRCRLWPAGHFWRRSPHADLTRLANEGISGQYVSRTTSICSPTRAALLTGRNHQRVGSGTIAERALDFDGYTGVIPKSSATIAEVLHDYGYKTAAFGKWHNTPATETTAMGPFDRWPTGYGFDYFYGFLAGETSQYEPRLFKTAIRWSRPTIRNIT